MKIFVSYTQKYNDITKEQLINIYSFLSQQKINSYIDCLVEETTQEKVENELKTSSLLLLVKTQNVYDSKWVNRELSLAKEYNIPIIEKQYDEIFITDFSFMNN